MKKIISFILVLVMLMSTSAFADTKTNDVETVTKEEYLKEYAEYHGVTYEEAEIINAKENAVIWNDYIEKNNLPKSRDLIYNHSESYGGATLWYVKAIAYTPDPGSVRYGAFGKVISDAHSKTFVKGSFDVTICQCVDSSFDLRSESVYVDDDSYTRLYISLDTQVQITITEATSLGISGGLVNAGYTISQNTYYKKLVTDNFTETF